MTPRRGGQVPPPPGPDEWELRYATKIERQYPGPCSKAKARMRTAPLTRSDVQKPLSGRLGSRLIKGVALEQWQYDIASGARVWYCVDRANNIVWLTLASAGHPRATTAKNKRGSQSR